MSHLAVCLQKGFSNLQLKSLLQAQKFYNFASLYKKLFLAVKSQYIKHFYFL